MPAPFRSSWSRLAVWSPVLGLVLSVVSWPAASLEAQEVHDEDSVKAAFIYHFSTFVVWPESDRPEPDFVIAVLGDDDVAEALQRYLPGRSTQGRPMRARRLDSIDELGNADVLFIGSARNRELEKLVAAVAERPLLLVTDAEGGLDKGSMINFRIVDGRVRFEVSLPAAERTGLILSSRLLAAAMYVDTTSGILPPSPETTVSSKSAGRIKMRGPRNGRSRTTKQGRRQQRP